MRAIDTNVIVRFLVGDDARQAEKARALIGHEPLLVPRTVLLEVEWVLRGVYGMRAGKIVAALRAFAGLPGVTIEDAALVAKAMGWAEGGMDFADALHLAASTDCAALLSFDRRFSRAAARLGGTPVEAP